MIQPFLVLSTRACLPYAQKVVNELDKHPERMLFPETIDYTNELSVMHFADGEMEVTLHKSVRGKLVFLFAACSRNEEGLSVEECSMELHHTIDVLQRSQAKKIIIFEPYVSASRSDRTTRRNSVGLWIHYKSITSLGANHLITYQLHSDKSKTIFDPCLCSIDDVPAISLVQKYLCEKIICTKERLNGEVRDDWLFCSVDAGGEKLAKRFAASFGTQLIIAHKQRSYLKANTIECINILSAVPLEGKKVWIIDDMIDTAGSVFGLVSELSGRNCSEINILIVHPVLSNPAVDRLLELKKSGKLNRLVVCDTISCTIPAERLSFMEVINSTPLSAQIIMTITQDMQMADIIDSFTPEKHLK